MDNIPDANSTAYYSSVQVKMAYTAQSSKSRIEHTMLLYFVSKQFPSMSYNSTEAGIIDKITNWFCMSLNTKVDFNHEMPLITL